MKTDNFDKHAKANLAFYHNFMEASKYVAAGVAVILVLIAIFLL